MVVVVVVVMVMTDGDDEDDDDGNFDVTLLHGFFQHLMSKKNNTEYLFSTVYAYLGENILNKGIQKYLYCNLE